MKKVFYLLVVVILIGSNIYFVKNNDLLKNKLMVSEAYTLIHAVNNMNLQHINEEDLKIQLLGSAMAFFEIIGKGDDCTFKQLNEEGVLCYNWNKNTKQQYKDLYLNYMEIKDFNQTHKLLLKGLDITEVICQKNSDK